MKIEAEEILSYHLPRWEELPEIELYIDQVTYILQNNLAVFSMQDKAPMITASMINNYVKQGVIKPPTKKKYNREHLAYLFVICILKRLMSLSAIGESIRRMLKIYEKEAGYNLFCEELEAALCHAFTPDSAGAPIYSSSDKRENVMLRAIVSAFANTLLVDKLILMRDA